MTSHTSPTPARPTRRRRGAVTALAVAATLALALAACGGDDDDDAAATDDDTAETTSGDAAAPAGDEYRSGGADEDEAESEAEAGASADAVPYEVTEIEYTDVSAPAGGTIEITNSSGAPHTFTADDGAFDVSYAAGESATVEVPAEPGEYGFHCEVHPSMQATVTAE